MGMVSSSAFIPCIIQILADLPRQVFRKYSFSKGDVLTCDIRVFETLEMDGSTKVKYVISKVYGLPHYHRVPEEQNINFE